MLYKDVFNPKLVTNLLASCSLTLLIPVPRRAGHDTDLPLDCNILKTVRVNFAFVEHF